MISDKNTAKQISELMLETFYRLDDSCETVSRLCTPDEAAAYRETVGRVLTPIVLDIMEPLYERHPELKPPHWDEVPPEEPTM